MAVEEILARVLAPQDIKAQRLATCAGCDKKHETLPVCKECHCIINAKASLAEKSCPLNKWVR